MAAAVAERANTRPLVTTAQMQAEQQIKYDIWKLKAIFLKRFTVVQNVPRESKLTKFLWQEIFGIHSANALLNIMQGKQPVHDF